MEELRNVITECKKAGISLKNVLRVVRDIYKDIHIKK